MAYFTKNQARAAATANNRRSFYNTSSNESLLDSVRKSTEDQSFDVFLSHSIIDADLVLGIKILLEEQGLSVYVDWDTDKQLSRELVNKETAHLLRKRMRQSKSLIYISTTHSSNSKWMPWELGFFDGYSQDSIAILPLTDEENDVFVGQEYLSLYPIVTKNQYNNGIKDLFVEARGSHRNTLKEFGKDNAS
jgi:hypothetical protein